MAVIAKTYLDLVDLYKRQDKQGNTVDVIEMLHGANPLMQDALMMECNSGKEHLTTVRTGLAQATWGALYKGIPNSVGQTAQVTDTTGFVEARATVDCRLVDELSDGKGNVVRLQEAEAYLETIRQNINTGFFYANEGVNTKQFTGLAPRFNDLSAPNGKQIIDAGGTGGNLTSIWVVTWGDTKCQLLYPKGSFAGVKREDHGKQRVLDDAGDAYYAYEETFRQHVGVSVRDWRYVVRIANIDIDAVNAGTVDLYGLLRKAYYRHEGRRVVEGQGGNGRTVMYANTDILEALDGLATNAGSDDNFVRLSTREIQGQEVQTYRQWPIRETDALLNSEERVV